jgi:ABC-type antimicrobial peptide transport system permease subunit
MIRNYFKIAWRNLVRNKVFSAINIAGLAVGMAFSILILVWALNELSYDRFHPGAQQIFRLTCVAGDGDFLAAVSPAGMAEGLQHEVPGIEATLRISDPITAQFAVGDEIFEESEVFYADPSFFDFFAFPLSFGNKDRLLIKPDELLLTEATAIKYFGSAENAMGRTVKMDNSEVFTVAAVLRDIPSNSHLQFDILLPMTKYAKVHPDLINKVWDSFNFYTYLKLDKQIAADEGRMKETISAIDKAYSQRAPDTGIAFNLQPLPDIHLGSELQIDLPGRGNIAYVRIFLAVAVFILFVACINFMNLSTARATKRAREVGLRKVIGAGRKQLIIQFLGESLLISCLSLLLAVGLAFMLMPVFNSIAGKELQLRLLRPVMWGALIGLAICTGLVSGSYPAVFLSGFRPAIVLKGPLKLGASQHWFRNGLVVLQFTVSILLLIGTGVVYKQLEYMREKDLGYNKENLIYMKVNEELFGKQDALRARLSTDPATANFTVISYLPDNLFTGDVDADWEGKDPALKAVVHNMRVDEHFLSVFGMELLAGRGFSGESASENTHFIINEKTMRLMGKDLENILGQRLYYSGTEGSVIGVVRDFNYKPLQYHVEPLVLRYDKYGNYAVIRAASGTYENVIHRMENIHESLAPGYLFRYGFIDQELNNSYEGEARMSRVFTLFSMLAIFISCMGLYGLSAFIAEQRVKEIGIRKVLGSGLFSLLQLLSQDFMKPILLALAIACPLSWFAMDSWLKDFAYRTSIPWWVFLQSGLLVIAVAMATISYRTLKAANADPVKSLRTE